RLASVQGFEHGEFTRALLENARDPEQVLRPLRAGQRRPAVLERLARAGNCALDLLRRRLADLGEWLLARRSDRRVRLAWLQPLAADEMAVSLVELEHLPRLRRRGGFRLPAERR